ncbi:DinB family protein [Deinococcus sp. NW-56]|uniref:DinB family protein n=1 Tax=Deinococcus sp. NW-56 TaxID=2080419 RepID=UPI000CF4A6F7|nr:DinB family protein [Deinococcus sp. NW-56]
MTATPDWQRWYRIEPQARYTPQIGALVEMMAYVRMTTLHDVKGLTAEQLDATPPGFENSIGALLTHIAAVERAYHLFSLEGRDLDRKRDAALLGGLSMGREGTPPPSGQSLETLLGELQESRAVTLAALAERDDAWLASRLTVPGFDFPNHHWAWFHVMEDEVNHRGQIRLIRKLVAPAPQPEASA